MKSKKVSRHNTATVSTPPERGESDDQRLQRLAAEGVIVPGTGSLPDGFWELERPADPEGAVLKGLLEERQRGSRDSWFQPLDSL